MSATQCRLRRVVGSSGVVGCFAIPTGVAFTIPSAADAASARSSTAVAMQPVPSRARASVSAAGRLVSAIRTLRAPSSRSACPTALPAPPAPIRSTMSIATPGRPRRTLSAKPQQSVLWPHRPRSPNTTVFTAPTLHAASERVPRSGSTSCL